MRYAPQGHDAVERTNSARTAQAKFTAHSRENERENSIHDSPAQTAQRMKLQSLFGNAVQRQETEDELKAAQRVEDKDELQKKSAPAQMKNEDDNKTSQLKTDPAQRKDDDEIQTKRDDQTAQRAANEEELKQAKFATQTTQLKEAPAAKPNNTGLPDNLKNGIESLSGMSMDSVKVHYNSSQPAQLNALAYAQGTDIHVAPGQEQHLPHEAWHVVQQAQGRVRPTMQMKEGVPVNDDKTLEHEADVMGAKADAVGVMQGKSVESVPVDFLRQTPTRRERVVQAGGQIGKLSRLTSERMSPPKPKSTGGMWLVETDAAQGFHQQVRIGQYYHTAIAVSFGWDGPNNEVPSRSTPSLEDASPTGQGHGVVYLDNSKPQKQIQHCPMTEAQRELANQILLSKLNERGDYDVLSKNCVHWSMKTFDEIKEAVKKK